MRQIFKDSELQKKFVEEGYVVVPFLSEAERAQCRRIHEALPKPGLEESFYTSHWSRDQNYRKLVHDQLNPLLSQKAQQILHRCRSSYSYFMVKFPSEKGEVTLHQDWSQVDERKHTGVTLWCPLVDTNLQNGSFHIVKKSHQFLDNLRGTGINPYYQDICRYIEQNYLTELPVKAGNAVLFDQRLLHYSPPNRSNEVRIVVGHVAFPEEYPFRHFYLNPKFKGEKVEIYEGGDDFLIEFAFGDDPEEKLKKVGEMEPDRRKLTEADFDALYKQYNSTGFFQKLKENIKRTLAGK